ncbi:MAG: pro-sigmaK processing inhibitor BofA family protein [Eubacteriales bacterium]|nr:pro-sigmaK processing inhibitor BofA family protein [Eubacteriales bacterium]
MEKGTGILMIAGACLLVLFIGAVKNKAEWLLNFCIRTVCGGITIYGINFFLEKWGIPCAVGLNPVSLLTSGTLGFGGVSLLYAVSAFHLL